MPGTTAPSDGQPEGAAEAARGCAVPDPARRAGAAGRERAGEGPSPGAAESSLTRAPGVAAAGHALHGPTDRGGRPKRVPSRTPDRAHARRHVLTGAAFAAGVTRGAPGHGHGDSRRWLRQRRLRSRRSTGPGGPHAADVPAQRRPDRARAGGRAEPRPPPGARQGMAPARLRPVVARGGTSPSSAARTGRRSSRGSTRPPRRR